MVETGIDTTERSARLDFDFVLDRRAEVPIGVQLAWALRARIRDGRLKPGSRLPGLRELSEALNINTNTARAVYQRLEHEGIIDCQQGSGSFVAQAPQRHSAVGAIAANAAEEAHATGVDPRDVAAALYVAPESSSGDSSEQAQRRRALRTQISVLERTVAELEAKHPTLAAKPAPSPAAEPGPRLLGEEELEQLQASLIRRLAAIQVAIDRLGRPQDSAAQRDPNAAQQDTSPAAASAAAPRRGARAKAKARPAPAGA